ncbi:MAG: T9SS type A sorting domain-containing protein [Ignavibacteria bacterium]|nr:T9SS type A sorting domain-containing protein [Ignavibacteria bacterium]
MDSSITTQLRDIEFINNSSDTGWIVGRSNTVLKTTNSGNNWFSMSTPVNEEFTSVKFVNSKTGWIAGFSGVILKTINGDLTGVNSVNGNVPDGFNLSQNYPNPFNPSTIIRYTLPESGIVSLNVYDVNGKEVTQLMNKYYAKGNYEIRFDGTQLSSGVYFYKLTSGNFVDTKMMTLIK